jgi:hypothetical protein
MAFTVAGISFIRSVQFWGVYFHPYPSVYRISKCWKRKDDAIDEVL